MKTVITLQELAEADLRPYSEIWLTSAEALAESGHSEDEMCLWRSVDCTPFRPQASGVWLVVDDIDDPQQVLDLENDIRQRLQALGLRGEFYPVETGHPQ